MPDATRPQFVSSIPRHQHEGYQAVYEVIGAARLPVELNAVIWKAVEAYRTTSEPTHERQVREQVAAAIEETADAEGFGDYERGLQRAARVARREPGA
jgi:hypothetical protein